MNKLAKILASVIIGLAVLSLFGWMSVQIASQNKEFGFLTEPIKQLYSFPELSVASVEEAKTLGLPKTFMKTPENFQEINKLKKDLVVLSAYSDTGNSRTVALINLRNDSVLRKWTFSDPIEDHERIFHPLLMPNGDLVYSFKGKSLMRVDPSSNLIWKQDQIWPHHAKELNSEGDIWVNTYTPGYRATGVYRINGKKVFFKDESITKIDGETGEILFQKSIAEILKENGLSNYLLKSGSMSDPIHTNDVQPALKTTEFYHEDDVFISAKQLSAILHYRPQTNELIRVIEGPFVSQHDVDFYDDNSLVFFNNNYYISPMNNYWEDPKSDSSLVFAGDLYSNIVKYDFNTESFSFLADSVFKSNQIFSMTEGLIDFYEPNTCLVEQQNAGVLWVIKDDEVIYKDVLKSFHEGYHHLPNWTRVVKNLD